MSATTLKPVRTIPWDLIAICACAAAFRFWELGIKPPHFDEGINGHFVQTIWRNGFYSYDPTNFHGPLFFYFLQVAEMLFGRSVVAYRSVAILFSLLILTLVYMHKKWLGPSAKWAALFLAVSPAFAFYSRYAIHEMLFVFGEVLFCYGFLTYLTESRRRGLLHLTTATVILLTTKETFFIFMGTLAIAWAMVRYMPGRLLMPRLAPFPESGRVIEPVSRPDRLMIYAVGALAFLGLFNGFFQHWQGALDFFRAFAFWSKTGTGGTGHSKEMIYWVKLMARYEWWALLSLAVALPLAFWPSARVGIVARFMALLALGSFASYSLIPYKTPWLILNMLWPIALGFGLLIQSFPKVLPRSGRNLAVLVLCVHALKVSYDLNFHNYENDSEPYVYVQTTNQFKAVISALEKKRAKFPEVLTYPIAVLNRDTWPLPWVLGEYTKNSFTQIESWRPNEEPMLILSDAKDRAEIERRIKGQWYVMPFQIRHSYENGFAFFKADLFRGFLPEDAKLMTVGQQ